MILIKILKRKDASSLIVAIIVATIIWQALSLMTGNLATQISGINEAERQFSLSPYGNDWQRIYLYPVVSAILQLIFLEILTWVVVLGGGLFRQPIKKK